MIKEVLKRKRIINKINKIPSERLKEVEDFISNLEKETMGRSKFLTYAGAWQDLDDETHSEFTEKLISRRSNNRRRIND